MMPAVVREHPWFFAGGLLVLTSIVFVVFQPNVPATAEELTPDARAIPAAYALATYNKLRQAHGDAADRKARSAFVKGAALGLLRDGERSGLSAEQLDWLATLCGGPGTTTEHAAREGCAGLMHDAVAPTCELGQHAYRVRRDVSVPERGQADLGLLRTPTTRDLLSWVTREEAGFPSEPVRKKARILESLVEKDETATPAEAAAWQSLLTLLLTEP